MYEPGTNDWRFVAWLTIILLGAVSLAFLIVIATAGREEERACEREIYLELIEEGRTWQDARDIYEHVLNAPCAYGGWESLL